MGFFRRVVLCRARAAHVGRQFSTVPGFREADVHNPPHTASYGHLVICAHFHTLVCVSFFSSFYMSWEIT